MKIIEPLSSALLLTGCVYAAGIAQNSAFMRVFGINPAFSQPAIDKIIYDGGLITFELFVRHLIILSLTIIALAAIITTIITVKKLIKKIPIKTAATPIMHLIQSILETLNKASSVLALSYLIILTFLSYEKAQEDGKIIAGTFISTCHTVVIEKESNKTKGCAFNKDRDSIWYYTTNKDQPMTNSKLLSEIDQITYLDPVEL